MQVASGGVLAGNAVVNILLAGSLNQIWSMINNLQIAIHSPLINVQFPGNAFMIYEVMITVATFDILPTDDFYPYFLSVEIAYLIFSSLLKLLQIVITVIQVR